MMSVVGGWQADDGTEWVYSPELKLWTGWVPGEDGVWTMSAEDFDAAYPEHAS